MDDKPALLDSLQQQNYPIYEVKFETMLDIVEACSHLQIQRNSPLTSPFNKTNTAVNMWSLLKGIHTFEIYYMIKKNCSEDTFIILFLKNYILTVPICNIPR